MNPNYVAFIELGKSLVREINIPWDIPVDAEGFALDQVGWNLTAATKALPPNHYLRDFARDAKAIAFLERERGDAGMAAADKGFLSTHWQDLLKAAAAEQLLFRRNSVLHVAGQILRPIRVIATCTVSEPWELTVDDIREAIRVAAVIQPSGKLKDLIIGIVKTAFDRHHLSDAGQLYASLNAQQQYVNRGARAKFVLSQEALRDDLQDRKRKERLPERRAFWELIRIVMTQSPLTFVDELRFAAIKVMIMTGFRIGEASLLPFDCKRERQHYDARGRPAGLAGGISTSLMIRHFAEKQQVEDSDSNVLVENMQAVPKMFVEMLRQTLDRVALLTDPLRKTLRSQCETRRLLPWYRPETLVSIIDLYIHATGSALWTASPSTALTDQYRRTFDPRYLHDLYNSQVTQYKQGSARLNASAYVFFNRIQKRMRENEISMRFRDARGIETAPGSRMSWPDTFLIAGEWEAYVQAETPSKVSDRVALPLAVGAVDPWDLMFLHPKRSLAEERGDSVCDVTRYMAVGRPDPSLISLAIGAQQTGETIFKRYGESDEDRQLTIESHSLRHMQNTELFRLGVADTIISKRFNRRSVAQSYEYDHRTLADELDLVELPQDIEIRLGEKAATVAKMIKTGKASGPIVDSFLRIQSSDGESAAYEYLRAEADGFHATPYGHCLNSFTVDPCPKHLECFSGCRHLSATNLPENRDHLIRLEHKLQGALQTIRERPSSSLGWKNQLSHAEQRIAGVQKILAASPGEHPFPDGPDLSKLPQAGVLDV